MPLLKEKEEILMKSQSVHEIFHALRPHEFFNYEILQFLIEGKDLKETRLFQHLEIQNFVSAVFEVPFNVLGHSTNIKPTKAS